jgi:RNA polymerase sigma factor (sigma-70 family)
MADVARPGPAVVALPDLLPLQRMDRDAWRAFYLCERRVVRAVLVGFTGYAADLEDLVQQVFLTAATLVRTGRVTLRGDERGLRAWVCAIAFRTGCAERRRRKEAGLAERDEDVLVAALPDPGARQVLRHAERAWESLPTRLRPAWLLRHLERMTVGEIALVLGLSPATVKRRLGEANRQFRSLASSDPVLREYLAKGAVA